MPRFKTIISTLLFFACSFNLIGQKLVISEEVIRYDDQDRMSIKVNLDPEPKVVKDALDDFMDDQYDVKLKGFGFLANKDVLSAEQVTMPSVSEKAFDLYFRIVKNVEGSQLNAFASYGYDVHINPDKYPQAFKALKDIVNNFLNTFLPEYYSNQVETTREFIADLQKDQEKLLEDIEKNKKEIAKLQEENEEMLQQTEENKSTLDEAAVRLKVRQTELTNIRKKLPQSDQTNQ